MNMIYEYETFNVGDAEVTIFYDEGAEDPREWSNIGTLLANEQGYSLGDHESELAKTWDYVCDLYGSAHYGWSLGAALAAGDKCYDGGVVWFADKSEDIDWEDAECECQILIPLIVSAGSYAGVRKDGYPVVGRDECRRYVGEIVDGKTNPIAMYVVTTADMIREYDEVTSDTLDKALDRALSEVEAYDAYLRGEVYGIWVSTPDGEADTVGGLYDIDEVKQFAIERAEEMDAAYKADLAKEKRERDYWLAREVITVG